MRNLIFTSTFLLSIIIFSCNTKTESSVDNQNESLEDSLYNELMAVHDEMMPKMQDIMKLQSELSSITDSLAKVDTVTAKVFQRTITQLQSADKAMMDWMHQFEPKMDSLTSEQKVNYLTNQKAKMDSVKLVMQTAIEDGNGLLEVMPLSD